MVTKGPQRSRRLVVGTVLIGLGINTLFLYWAISKDDVDGKEGMLGRIMGGADAQNPKDLVNTRAEQVHFSRCTTLQFHLNAKVGSGLQENPCKDFLSPHVRVHIHVVSSAS